MKDKEGKLLTGKHKIMKQWREYFEELLENEPLPQEGDVQTVEEKQYSNEDDIIVEEVEEAVKNLRVGKAARHDAISPEMIK